MIDDSEDDWLVIAPHYQAPAMNGADVLIEQRYVAISKHVRSVTILGEHQTVFLKSGAIESVETYTNTLRNKSHAAVRTLLLRSHYFLERFVTKAYDRELQRRLSVRKYSTIVVSFLAIGNYALTKLRIDETQRVFIETHNDEYKWFGDIIESSSSVPQRLVAQQSINYLRIHLSKVADQSTLFHVTAGDHAGYVGKIGSHNAFVVPVGVALKDGVLRAQPGPLMPLKLIFFGSLSVKMNFDALKNFEELYYPVLKQALGDSLSIDVAGSNPTDAVIETCKKNGWKLTQNPDDNQLDELISNSHALVMPFTYSNGGKLKLLHSMALGVPVIGTAAVGAQINSLEPPLMTFSDSPAVWVETCRILAQQGLTVADKVKLKEAADQFSWDRIAISTMEMVSR